MGVETCGNITGEAVLVFDPLYIQTVRGNFKPSQVANWDTLKKKSNISLAIRHDIQDHKTAMVCLSVNGNTWENQAASHWSVRYRLHERNSLIFGKFACLLVCQEVRLQDQYHKVNTRLQSVSCQFSLAHCRHKGEFKGWPDLPKGKKIHLQQHVVVLLGAVTSYSLFVELLPVMKQCGP